MNQEEPLREVLESLEQIQCEDCIPRNLKVKIREIQSVLSESNAALLSIRVDKSIQELEDLAEDQFVPMHIRTQIWCIVSRLECI